MESRLSWMRAVAAAEHYDATVICAEPFADVHCDVHALVPGLKIITVAHTPLEKSLIHTPFGFYLAYRLWHWRVFQLAKKLHLKSPFALAHQVSYCGYREPGYCWQLGIPFVWGPIGGTQNVPWRFLSQLDLLGALKEASRSVANAIQLRFGIRVGKVLHAAKAVFVANQQAQDSFRKARGVRLPVQLETGLDHVAESPRLKREDDQPLRVLWTGRLEAWKALPLLLKAVAKLPEGTAVQVRVLGSGSRAERWKRLATQLGINHCVEWIRLPEYGERDQHYQWADVLAFTSLRDTSGTGLLEALAAGVPILGIDHQGAHDIMTADCAIPVSVTDPQQTIAEFQVGLLKLSEDTGRLQQLSMGALARAKQFMWGELNTEMVACYEAILGRSVEASTDSRTRAAGAINAGTNGAAATDLKLTPRIPV